jgi:type I restriction enzyme M protein
MAGPSTIKSLFTIFRKDAGVDGELQRLEQLAWMVFLKAMDDREVEREILDERYRSPIPERLRWRSFAATDEPISGDALLSFVNERLLPGLRELPASRDEATTLIREVFLSARNLMKSGVLLRQAIETLSQVDFNSLSSRREFLAEFEAVLGDTRGAGESVSPAALARFVVEMLDPELGEFILDPACGAGMFLTAAVERLRDRWVRAPQHAVALERSIMGTERRAFGWLLCATNLLLHGLVVPSQIRLTDPLSRPLKDYGPRDRVDIILGVLPFGASVPPEMLENVPVGFRTRDREALHLLLVLHLLRPGGRAAVVVPNGLLFRMGAVGRVREKLLEECNLHTVVRLPGGVFSPYPNIETNILFFTQGQPTKEVWFYQHQHPEGLRTYSKRRPLRLADFDPLRAWWGERKETDVAFRVSIDEIKARDLSLNLPNPRGVTESAAAIAEKASPPSPRPDLHPASAPLPLTRAQGAMRLLSLRLRDFRGYAKLDLDLPASGPAVLIGVNGAGKSTVLDAVAMLLSPFAAIACGQSARQAEIQLGDDDIRAGEEAASVGATFRIDGEEQYWELRSNHRKGVTSVPRELTQSARILSERLQAEGSLNLPVLCFYSANRGLDDDSGGKQRAYPSRQLHAYDRAFGRGMGPFQDFLRWFREEEDLENQIRLREDARHRNPRLEVVRQALQTFLSNLGAARFSDLRIERVSGEGASNGAGKQGALVVEKDKVPLRIEQLSEGEKNTILLISDLARRFSVANPGRENPLEGDGIVLIDELDLHLHPGWQRGFLPALGATFPGCQFLVSTHSPQALSKIRKEHVFIIENFERVLVTPFTYGRDSNSILNEVMGLPERPVEIEEKIRQASILVDKERMDEAKVALGELASILGEHDSEVVRLKTMIAFLND